MFELCITSPNASHPLTMFSHFHIVYKRLREERANRLIRRAFGCNNLSSDSLSRQTISRPRIWQEKKRPWAIKFSIVYLFRFWYSLQTVVLKKCRRFQLQPTRKSRISRIILKSCWSMYVSQQKSLKPVLFRLLSTYHVSAFDLRWALKTFSQSIFLQSGSCAKIFFRRAFRSWVRVALPR